MIKSLLTGCLTGEGARPKRKKGCPPIMLSYPYGIICVSHQSSSIELERCPTTPSIHTHYLRHSVTEPVALDSLPDDRYDMYMNNPFIDACLNQRRASMTLYRNRHSKSRNDLATECGDLCKTCVVENESQSTIELRHLSTTTRGSALTSVSSDNCHTHY